MDIVRGVGIIALIVILAGVIAYIGDRVGHQIGRRRLTLFNLRPKYTSTIVAVGTGMLIALFVTLVAVALSQNVQTALFRIGTLNNQLQQLQAQAQTTRNSQIVLSKFQPIEDRFLVIQPTQTPEERLKALSIFFDEAVRAANASLTPRPLKPYKLRSSDAEVRDKLRAELGDPLVRALLDQRRVPTLFLPVADQNLFRGERIHFGFLKYGDVRVLRANQTLGTIRVEGGAPVDFNTLLLAAQNEAVNRGMPFYFVRFPVFNRARVESIAQQVAHGRGAFRIVVKTAQDTYPSTGALIVDFNIEAVKS